MNATRHAILILYLKSHEDVRGEDVLHPRPGGRQGQGGGDVQHDKDEVAAAEGELREHQRHVHHELPALSEGSVPQLGGRKEEERREEPATTTTTTNIRRTTNNNKIGTRI